MRFRVTLTLVLGVLLSSCGGNAAFPAPSRYVPEYLQRSASGATQSQAWPQFRFDAARSGFNPFEHILSVSNVAQIKQKWAFTANGSINASPAVVNGVVYVPSGTGMLYALKASSGSLIWQTPIIESASSPAIVNGVVYVGSGIDSGDFYAVDAATGKILWKVVMGGILSSPTVVNGTIYVGADRSNVIALSAATGHFVWNTRLDANAMSSPAVAGGKVYIGSEGGTLYALDAAKGHVLWRNSDALASIQGAVAVANGLVYFGALDGKLHAVDAATGKGVWTASGNQSGSQVRSSPAVANGIAYVGFSTGEVLAVNAKTGSLVWRGKTSSTGAVEGSPSVANGVLYVPSEDNNLYAFNAATGSVLKKVPLNVFLSSPVISNGQVYMGSFSDDKVHAYGLK